MAVVGAHVWSETDFFFFCDTKDTNKIQSIELNNKNACSARQIGLMVGPFVAGENRGPRAAAHSATLVRSATERRYKHLMQSKQCQT